LLITANKSKSSGALFQVKQSNNDNLFVEPQAYLDEFFGKIKGAGVLLAPRNLIIRTIAFLGGMTFLIRQLSQYQYYIYRLFIAWVLFSERGIERERR